MMAKERGYYLIAELLEKYEEDFEELRGIG